MKPTLKLLIVGGFVVAAVIIVLLAKGGKPAAPATPGSAATQAEPTAKATTITVVYSTEKKDWIEAASADFAKSHPDIKVELVGKGSIDAAQAILDGGLQPTVWSPADTMAMNLLASDWQTKNHADLISPSGADAAQALLLTPLVFVCWEDRAEALLKASGGVISWKALHTAVTSPKGWLAVGGQGKWGFVKLGHTDPTKSNSGLEALYLMALEFTGKPKLAIEDLLDPKLQEFVRGVEKGVTKFEASTGTFMTDMVRFGPSKYDIAVVYESLAISELANAAGRWGKLKVYYPATTIWSDHPIALMQGAWVTAEQKTAARKLIAYLRSKPAQQRALEFGFRPADTSIPVVSSDAQNPFTRLAPDGITVDVPTAAAAPDGVVVRNLMMMWTRLVQP
jgi:ABC-type glycerol-3-phosphate transport system substrate-binding protein